MFFALSKLTNFLYEPIVWLISLLVRAVLTKNQQKKRRLLRGGLFLTIILTNPFISSRIFEVWEGKPVSVTSLTDTFDIGIVLGGFGDFNVADNGLLNFNASANRFTDALALYKMGKIRRVLITGGSGQLVGKKTNEAAEVKRYWQQLNLPDSAIIIENDSRNTYENAAFTKQLIDTTFSGARCLLITSASHIPRAKACFDKIGLECAIFPTNFVAKKLDTRPSAWFYPDNNAFFYWNIFIKEWIGYVVYKMKGYL